MEKPTLRPWRLPKWLSDERPPGLMRIDRTVQRAPKVESCACPRTPDGKCTKCICPIYRYDLMRAALAIQDDERIHCLLVRQPAPEENVPREDLNDWVLAAQKRIQNRKPIYLIPEGKHKFPCGDSPLCQQHERTCVEETLEEVDVLTNLVEHIDDYIRKNFLPFTSREKAILHMWFFNKNSKKPSHPITQKELATKVNCSVRYIAKIISKAKNYNCSAYNLLNRNRKSRAQITHGYTVDERTAARDD
jgi:hypothetical protein